MNIIREEWDNILTPLDTSSLPNSRRLGVEEAYMRFMDGMGTLVGMNKQAGINQCHVQPVPERSKWTVLLTNRFT